MKNNYIKTVLGPLACCLMFSMCSSNGVGEDPIVVPPVSDQGDVSVLTTTISRSKDLAKTTETFSKKDNMSPSTIKLVPTETYQTIVGFGAAITGSSCYNLMQMTAESRAEFLKETFSPTEGYGFSYVRISIGCSDFSLSEFTCCDKKGIENFALQSEDLTYVIPVLKEILAINPTLKIMGSPWTCPKWMKVKSLDNRIPYDSWTGGHLNPDYYQDYATYFVKWIQAFKSHGIDIFSITPQNEPLNGGNSASLRMDWEEELAFVKTALGPSLATAGLDVKIYAFDHNYNYDDVESQKNYPLNIYADAEAAKYFAGAAYHNYGGDIEELVKVHNAAPQKELVFSETSIGTWSDGRDLTKRLMNDMEWVALGTVNRWCNGVIVWNLMLDTDRGPNRNGGCQTCDGAVNISKDYKTIMKNSHYYILAHMSSVVKPGAVRIGTTGYKANGLTYSAFKNVDGSYAIVLSNDSDEYRTVVLDDGVKHFSNTLPPRSAVSLQWKD